MTNKDYTHLAVLVDRSGSMITIKNDMIGGLDALFKSQAEEPGTCLVDYAQFDNVYELVYEDKPVSEAKAELAPYGATALLDGIGHIITYLGDKLNTMDEDDRPGNVIVAVITDGYENSSREWTHDAVKKLITQQRGKYNWKFVFLGASEDAVSVAQSYGFSPDSALHYKTSGESVINTSGSLSTYVSQTRATGSAAFSDADRKAAAGK